MREQFYLETEGKYKWQRTIREGQRGYGLRLTTERWVLGFIYNDFRERKGGKAELKRK
jgi:hypothetical protein